MTAFIQQVLTAGATLVQSGDGLPPLNTKLPVGTVFYSAEADQRYKLYSQGDVRYWLATGKRPVVQREVDTGNGTHYFVGVNRADDTWTIYRYVHGETNPELAEGALNFLTAWGLRTGLVYD
jgi:hypothetical protein